MKVNQWLFGVYYVNNCQLCCTWRALHPAVAFSIQNYVSGVRNRGSSINVQYCHVLLSWCLVYRLIIYFTVCTLLLITAYQSVTQSIIIMNALTKLTKNTRIIIINKQNTLKVIMVVFISFALSWLLLMRFLSEGHTNMPAWPATLVITASCVCLSCLNLKKCAMTQFLFFFNIIVLLIRLCIQSFICSLFFFFVLFSFNVFSAIGFMKRISFVGIKILLFYLRIFNPQFCIF